MSAQRRSSDLLHTRSVGELPDQLQQRTLLDADGHSISLRAAAASDAGTFEGYGCLWDVRDSYGTTFSRGCFGSGGLDENLYALLWMHNPELVIGTFRAREDDTGLWLSGEWDQTPEGQTARARAKSGSAPELSVGFVPLMVDPGDDTRFTQVRLVETSQITARMAAVPGAGFSSMRSLPKGVPTEQQELDERGDAGAAAIASVLLALSQRVSRR